MLLGKPTSRVPALELQCNIRDVITCEPNELSNIYANIVCM
jgi:hypothetical protein